MLLTLSADSLNQESVTNKEWIHPVNDVSNNNASNRSAAAVSRASIAGIIEREEITIPPRVPR